MPCDYSKSVNLIGASFLAHVPCLLANVLLSLGIGTAFAADIHKSVPILFLISIGCMIGSLSRWKKMSRTKRIIVATVSLVVLALWIDAAMGHSHHHSM
jgi:hypothetical protein